MLTTLMLPLTLSGLSPVPVETPPLHHPEPTRTEVALTYASQYVEIGSEVSTEASFGGSCTIIEPVGFGFCLAKCGQILALIECDL